MSALALSLALASPPSHPNLPTPRGNLAGVFVFDDYPAEALQKDQQGDVEVSVHVDATGTVSDCLVKKSSGFSLLDERTCDVIRKRATFKPALDRRGRGVASEYHQTISWRIAETQMPSKPWVWRKVIDLNAFGDATGCHIDLEGAIEAKPGVPPSVCSTSDMKGSLRDKGQFGHPVDKVIVEHRFTPSLASVPPLGADEGVLETIVLQLAIDATGKLKSCKVTEQAGSKPAADPCVAIAKSYAVRNAPDGKPASFTATEVMTTRVHLDLTRPPLATPIDGSLQGLFQSDDYPAQALDRGDQGEVGIVIRTDRNGIVSDCEVEETSRSQDLDNQTCAIVRERAKFRPATNAEGGAVPGEYRSRIVWKIGDDATPSDPWTVRTVINFAPDGRTLSCRMEFEGAMIPPRGAATPSCDADATTKATPKIADLPGAVATLVIEQRFAPGLLSALAAPAGDILISRQIMRLDVDAGGKLTSCKAVAISGEDVQADPCADVDKQYSLHKGPDGKPAPFTATEIVTVYVRVEKFALAPDTLKMIRLLAGV